MEQATSRILALAVTLILSVAGVSWADAVGTAFTYQGQLKEAGSPANGTYDFRFQLLDHPEYGYPVGDPEEILGEEVTNGLFTVALDFGDVFDGDALWLEVKVRTAGAGSYETLTPRQPLTATPYALYALDAPGTGGEGNTLDQAYDQGGAGAGRTVTADAGAVQILGPDGLTVVGVVESTTGGFRFPDATTQSTAATSDHGQLSGLADDDHPQYVLHDEVDSVTTAMIQDEAVTGEKITSDVPATGEVLEWNGSSIVWDTDDTNGSGIGGSGTSNYVPKFTASTTLGNSVIYELNGDIGIGTTSPDEKLHVTDDIQVDVDLHVGDDTFLGDDLTVGGTVDVLGGNVDIPNAIVEIGPEWSGPTDTALRVDGGTSLKGDLDIGSGFDIETADGDLWLWGEGYKPGGGMWADFSDKRLKKNIRDLEGALEQLLALRGVTFEFKDPDAIHELHGTRIGLIAQEVKAVFPDWVDTGPDGYMRVTVRGLEALTVEALRELRTEKDAQIATQREQIADLSVRLERMEAVVAELTRAEKGGAR